MTYHLCVYVIKCLEEISKSIQKTCMWQREREEEREKQHTLITIPLHKYITRVIETTGATDDIIAWPTCECKCVIASTGRSNNQMICQALNQFRSLQTFGVSMTQLTLFIATWETDKEK